MLTMDEYKDLMRRLTALHVAAERALLCLENPKVTPKHRQEIITYVKTTIAEEQQALKVQAETD